jgi:charged multivesicular body protein 4
MWSWFGGAAAQKRKDAPKEAILGLRRQLDMLQKREKHVESLIAEQDAAARKHVATNKNGTVATTPRPPRKSKFWGRGHACRSIYEDDKS